MVDEKRFFRIDDDGHVEYFVVARDLDHAKEIVGKAGFEYGQEGVTFDKATALTWTEMSPTQVASRARCYTEDHRGMIPLTDAVIGDIFCTEW